MKINGIPVQVTDLPGNLKVITIPDAESSDAKCRNQTLYTVLRMKCAGSKPDILQENERALLPHGLSVVFTYDSYTRIVPYYCECTW